jgi:hypothetical protein
MECNYVADAGSVWLQSHPELGRMAGLRISFTSSIRCTIDRMFQVCGNVKNARESDNNKKRRLMYPDDRYRLMQTQSYIDGIMRVCCADGTKLLL